jgi:hypothetical protein
MERVIEASCLRYGLREAGAGSLARASDWHVRRNLSHVKIDIPPDRWLRSELRSKVEVGAVDPIIKQPDVRLMQRPTIADTVRLRDTMALIDSLPVLQTLLPCGTGLTIRLAVREGG